MVKEIPLTQGCVALVDDDWYEMLSQVKWYARKAKHTIYATRDNTPNGGKGCGKQAAIDMQRLIMDPPPNMVVDHIDRNGLNNTRANLRICTRAENTRNRRATREKIGKYKGTLRILNTGQWFAKIRFGDQVYIARPFATEEEAALAYNRFAQMLFGEFAYLNVIEKDVMQ